MKRYLLDYTSGGTDPSGGIIWSGEKIDCLDICPGQTLNVVIHNIAEKVCELAAPMDLSTLTLQCALDMFNNEETGNRTLASVLQLMIDNECGLKELIDGIQAQIDGMSEESLTLDLKCLAAKDSFGNLLPYDNQSVLQTLINEVCNLNTTVTGLGGKIIELEEKIEDIENRLPDGTEDLVSTCISISRTLPESIEDVAENLCNYKDAVGSTTDIQKAIAQQPADIPDEVKQEKGWELNPANLAESLNNLWLAYSNALDRIATLENTCCAVSCKDVSIGMELISSADGKGISIKFSEAAGTDIPTGFTDRGSSVVIEDSAGNILTYDIEVEQDGTTDQLSLVGLDLNNPLTITVTARVGSDSLTCEKCLSKQYSSTAGCPVCLVTASGTTGTITIVYSSNLV